jgi:hypothetical protein
MDDNLKAILERIQANIEADDERIRDRIKLWREHRDRARASRWREQRDRARTSAKRRRRGETWIILIAVLCVGILS